MASFQLIEEQEDASLRAKVLQACSQLDAGELQDQIVTLYFDNVMLDKKLQMLTSGCDASPLTREETQEILSTATAFEKWMGDNAKRRYLIAITQENIRLQKRVKENRCIIL